MMTFQEMFLRLEQFWAAQGCVIMQPYDIEKGAGTMNPATFFGALGPDPWRVAYAEPSRRPTDGRYGENPIRFYRYWQYQVLLKPSPDDVVDLYLQSLEHLGIDLKANDLRFVEDEWEAPTLGAWGRGWEVWLNGLEVTQFTYFQQMGGLECRPVSAEITYGLERLCAHLQGVDHLFELRWQGPLRYGDVYRREEYEHCRYSFEEASIPLVREMFDRFEEEAKRCLEAGLCFPAYDYVLKCSHCFNLLEARRAMSVSERAAYLLRVRELAGKCARVYLEGKVR